VLIVNGVRPADYLTKHSHIFVREGARVLTPEEPTDEKLARAKNLGANKDINYKSTPDWEKADVSF
jgi:hypothetical protein